MIKTYCDVCDNQLTLEYPRADNSVTELKLPKGGSLKITAQTTYKENIHVCCSCLAKHFKSLDTRPLTSIWYPLGTSRMYE